MSLNTSMFYLSWGERVRERERRRPTVTVKGTEGRVDGEGKENWQKDVKRKAREMKKRNNDKN